MRTRWWISASGLLISAGLITACGLITTPVSVPAAVTENMNFFLHGPIVDQVCNPLDGVVMSQELRRRFWTPIRGEKDTSKNELRVVNHNYSIRERGKDLRLTFIRDGYHDASYSMSVYDGPIVTVSHPNPIRCAAVAYVLDGEWVVNEDVPLPVVMYARDSSDSNLAARISVLGCQSYPKIMDGLDAIDLRKRLNIDWASVYQLPAGILHLTLEKGELQPRNAAGDIDPVDVNLPAKITLRINSDDGGFVPIKPQYGYAPLQTSEEAPDFGYMPALTIDQPRLREMRLASRKDFIGAHEYFYFRYNGHYGKGKIAWLETFARDKKTLRDTEFFYAIIMVREPGARRLISRTGAELTRANVPSTGPVAND